MINSSQCPLPTKHTQTHKTKSNALSGILTRDPNNQAVADLCLRPHDKRHQLYPTKAWPQVSG